MDSERLLRTLRSATDECVRGSDAVAVAYSGGVDSAVVERIARNAARTLCYTCALPGSHDHARAPVSAAEEGIELRMIVLDREKLKETVSKVCSALRTDDPLRVAYSVPVLSVIDAAEQGVILVGSGADELFGGYAKYVGDPDPAGVMDIDIKKMQSELILMSKYAKSVGKEIGAPFASPDVISFAKRLPMDRKLGAGGRKIILREVARSLGVVSHDLPKKAAQYSSGVMREMKKMAKEQGMDLRDWTAETAAKGRRIP